MITRTDLNAAAWRVVEREFSLCPDCVTSAFRTHMRNGEPSLSVGHDPACNYIRHPRLQWLATEWITAQLRIEGVPCADYGGQLVGSHSVRKERSS